jgi:hypothetical protein
MKRRCKGEREKERERERGKQCVRGCVRKGGEAVAAGGESQGRPDPIRPPAPRRPAVAAALSPPCATARPVPFFHLFLSHLAGRCLAGEGAPPLQRGQLFLCGEEGH